MAGRLTKDLDSERKISNFSKPETFHSNIIVLVFSLLLSCGLGNCINVKLKRKEVLLDNYLLLGVLNLIVHSIAHMVHNIPLICVSRTLK